MAQIDPGGYNYDWGPVPDLFDSKNEIELERFDKLNRLMQQNKDKHNLDAARDAVYKKEQEDAFNAIVAKILTEKAHGKTPLPKPADDEVVVLKKLVEFNQDQCADFKRELLELWDELIDIKSVTLTKVDGTKTIAMDRDLFIGWMKKFQRLCIEK
jgi:hypothetical protein